MGSSTDTYRLCICASVHKSKVSVQWAVTEVLLAVTVLREPHFTQRPAGPCRDLFQQVLDRFRTECESDQFWWAEKFISSPGGVINGSICCEPSSDFTYLWLTYFTAPEMWHLRQTCSYAMWHVAQQQFAFCSWLSVRTYRQVSEVWFKHACHYHVFCGI